ncbi:Sel1 repeat-containing protein [Mariprofundus ferrinatatus]|uniref:Sel1 repeat-containing protein n=1 Tax=Mariprofundus ferrinatatus TaxID=1921087 RepID=A0A2K8L2U6_9PROT|nr:tetratricopeptide repeat protein [Mariprofundus ferrinatatus]ATX81573.1 Sel1 repeat-containing protein [Mariprofundus ferrinatatus]
MLNKVAILLVCIGLISCGSETTTNPAAPLVTGVSDPAESIADQALLLASKGENTKAAELFLEAAEQGNRPAQYFLGLIYARGDGVEKDMNKAFMWLEKASMGGHPKAVYHLAEMYVHGEGTSIDHVKAMAWFWVGTTLGDRYAEKRLRAVAPRLTPEEMGDAKVLSKELMSKIPQDLKVKRVSLH